MDRLLHLWLVVMVVLLATLATPAARDAQAAWQLSRKPIDLSTLRGNISLQQLSASPRSPISASMRWSVAQEVGGLQITLQAAPISGQQIDDATLNEARNVIVRRLRELGVRRALVQTYGGDKIVAQLSAVDAVAEDPQGVIAMLQATGLLEIIDPQGAYLPPGTVVSTTLGGTTGPPIYTTIISGRDLKRAYITTDNTGTHEVIGIELQDDAATKFLDFTGTHLGEPMSFVIDKQVISSPRINGAISSQAIIEGVAPRDVMYVVAELRSGPLPVPFDVVQGGTIERVGVPVVDENSVLPESPAAIAEAILPALLSGDLAEVNQYLAPDRQADEWADVYTNVECRTASECPEMSGCQGVDYFMIQRPPDIEGVTSATVSITFDSACGLLPANSGIIDGWPIDQLVIDFSKSTGSWYVSSVSPRIDY